MMTEKRCRTCRYFDHDEIGPNGVCRRYSPHPKHGFPIIHENGDKAWCGEWMPIEDVSVFAIAPRDNFLDVFRVWSEYAEACHARGEEPIPLESFRRMESEWDETKGTNA